MTTLAVSPDGRHSLVGFGDLSLWLLDLKQGRVVRALKGKLPEESDASTGASFSADGRRVACGFRGRFGDALDTWNTSTGAPLGSFGGAAQDVAFSPDGKWLASTGAKWSASKAQWRVVVWVRDARTLRLVRALRLPVDGTACSLSFSPDGNRLVVGNDLFDEKTEMTTDTQIVSVWNVRSGQKLWVSRAPQPLQPLVAFSPDGRLVAHNGFYGVTLCDARDGRLVHTLKPGGGDGSIGCFAFSRDAKTLAVGTGSDIELWNIASGLCAQKWTAHKSQVSAIAYSADGRTLISGGEDHSVRVWIARTGASLRVFGRPVAPPAHNPFS